MFFGWRPFQFFNALDALVAQIIYFVEKLPEEWTANWEELKAESPRAWNDIPGTSVNPSRLRD
jgi:hypothetical protein